MELSPVPTYLRNRQTLLDSDEKQFMGEKLILNEYESKFNELILKEKHEELDEAYLNISKFRANKDFLQNKECLEQSKVFRILKQMPKGHSLHTHLLAAASVDFIITDITYRDNLYGGYVNGNFKLRFLKSRSANDSCEWTEISEMRRNNVDFDVWLKKQMSLEGDDLTGISIENVWSRFKKIFTTVYDMLAYKPVFQDYLYRVLEENHKDNVNYTELRGTFMPLYDLSGHICCPKEFLETILEVQAKFKLNHPDFLGLRYIHSIYRGVDKSVLSAGIKELISLKELFPNLIAGLDFVGFEEEGKDLLEFWQVLVDARKHLQFFFHAGETNWFGHTDLNLTDAILLNTTRIGHGFALSKHPALVNEAERRKIAVELCPISNQILKLCYDSRNHPVVNLLARGFPVVICNDDPSIWGASGLTYDWYVVFMTMVPRNGGTKVLKQFALNSIQYSALSDDEKKKATVLWTKKWKEFLVSINKI